MTAPRSAVASVCAAVVAGCGVSTAPQHGAASSSTPVPQTSTSAACTTAARTELVTIARRIYAQASTGRNAAAAPRRIERSQRLAVAVAAGDAAATRAELAPLLKHQITRIVITGADGRTLAHHGATAAYGPVRGTLRLGAVPVGRYVLAVSRQRDFASLVGELTGATARFRTAAADAPAADVALPATAFPDSPATIAVRLPHVPGVVCGPTAADTRAATVGLVARRLLDAEQRGAGAHRAIRHAEKDPAFRAAVTAADPAAVRAAIVGFFKDKHFHIVRGRVWNARGLVTDVGGPHVLSPAMGTIGAARFMLAIQDDTGYIKLLHRFTGADVTLSTAAGAVPGSNVVPGPAFASGLHAVRYHGRAWRAFGLLGTAFPSRPLQVLLLMR